MDPPTSKYQQEKSFDDRIFSGDSVKYFVIVFMEQKSFVDMNVFNDAVIPRTHRHMNFKN